MNARRKMPRTSPLHLAMLFEGGLALVALALAWLTGFPLGPWPGGPAGAFDASLTLNAIGWGWVGTLPLLSLLVMFDWVPVRSIRELGTFVQQHLGPLLGSASWWQLALLSLLAGVGEELLFRGWLQHGLGGWLFGTSDGWASIILAGTLFGVCHAVTRPYAVVAGLVGLYLGWLQMVSGHLLAPIVAHATYDFVALMYLLKWSPRTG